ncbi:MAG: hypothetical protein BWY88_00757 [Synergistetes bacterium ADurb.Bin520]|nr:MAG: hypothetical protein BWY88_00757 [Synergistetes bacterium ADurb.Bin520]
MMGPPGCRASRRRARRRRGWKPLDRTLRNPVAFCQVPRESRIILLSQCPGGIRMRPRLGRRRFPFKKGEWDEAGNHRVGKVGEDYRFQCLDAAHGGIGPAGRARRSRPGNGFGARRPGGLAERAVPAQENHLRPGHLHGSPGDPRFHGRQEGVHESSSHAHAPHGSLPRGGSQLSRPHPGGTGCGKGAPGDRGGIPAGGPRHRGKATRTHRRGAEKGEKGRVP